MSVFLAKYIPHGYTMAVAYGCLQKALRRGEVETKGGCMMGGEGDLSWEFLINVTSQKEQMRALTDSIQKAYTLMEDYAEDAEGDMRYGRAWWFRIIREQRAINY